MFVRLSKKLNELRDAQANFAIQVLSNKSVEESFNQMKGEAEALINAMKDLSGEYEAYKPFYPQEIYETVKKLHASMIARLILDSDKRNLIEKNTYYHSLIDMARRNSQDSDNEGISKVIEEIHIAIRKRVNYWEELHIE